MIHHPVRAIFVAVLLIATSLASAAEPNSSALAMVKKLRLGENLAPMSLQVATTTQTYRNMVQVVGSEKAQAILKDELAKTRPKYQDQWDKNLASAYAETFSPNELDSLAEKQKSSPFAGKFSAKQGEVGQSMQAKSTGLLKDYVAEVLNNAFSKVVPKK